MPRSILRKTGSKPVSNEQQSSETSGKKPRVQQLKKYAKFYHPQMHCLWTMPRNSELVMESQRLTNTLIEIKLAKETADEYFIVNPDDD